MNFRKLYRKNIAHYSRYYRLIAAATVITVAVIIGSIVVGDSVRATLENIVRERLGDTETIVFANNSFMDEAMTRNPVFGDKARGILLSNGFVSNNGTLLPVFVWGVSDMDIPVGSAKINEPLAKELKPTTAAGIVLRLPAAGLIPSGSLFVTENYTTSMRLDFAGVVDAKSGGNISMKNEQTLPLNIFVNRNELAELMQTEGKINLLLTDKAVSEADLSKAWSYAASGLSVHNRGAFTEVVSDRVFLQADVTKSIAGNNPVPNRLYSYLANAITFGNDSIPYSFVTALDRYMGEALAPDEVILTDYSADRLHAKVGDKVRLSYFTARDMKTLVIGYKTFTVKRILPISLLKDDPTLSANFPGLSDVERCTEWDSDLPINMSLITNEDERYWEVYRSIPKALVSYAAIEAEWSNPFGDATAVRVHTPTPDLSMLTPQMFGLQLIRPREAGFAAARNGVDFSSLFLALGCFIIAAAVLLMITPLSEMLYRRRDEIRLMQALGFKQKRIRDMLMGEAVPVLFVCGIAGIVAGLLYTLVVMWLLGNVWSGATHASDFSFGFTPSLLSVAICFGPLLGLCVVWPVISKALKKHDSQDRWQSHPAICATVKTGGKVVPQLARRSRQVAKSSRNLRDDQDRWQSRPATCAATKTGGKVVPPSARPSGQVADTSPLPPPKEGDKHLPIYPLPRRGINTSLPLGEGRGGVVLLLLLGGVGAAALLYKSVVLFVILGLVLLIAGGLAGYYTVLSNGSALGKRFSSWQMIWRTIYAGRKQAVLSFATLAAGVFIVFAVGLNRRGFNDSSALLSGTGGYTLWCESSIPVYHNMQTKEGREKLSLTDLPSDASVMQCLRHSADDASCLNLNKVTTPSVLGLNLDDIRNSDFVVAQNIFGTDGDAVFDRLSRKDGNVYPALVDETVLMWSLGKQLGDTLYYEADGGERIGLVLAATLSNSIFQGYVIIDRDLFADVWGETTGSEVFLLKTTDDETADVRTLLAQALNEYGIRVTTTNDRLKEFDSVTDTYLTIFMTLGGLGLLLGIMSFIIVIRKNLASRRGEISLYRMLGFTDERIFGVLYRENLLVPLFAIGIGVVSALVSIALGFMNVSVWIWLTAILLMLLLCLPVLVFVRRSVLNTIKATK